MTINVQYFLEQSYIEVIDSDRHISLGGRDISLGLDKNNILLNCSDNNFL